MIQCLTTQSMTCNSSSIPSEILGRNHPRYGCKRNSELQISKIITLCHTCKLCDPIAMEHGTATEPNTYSRGSGRIKFVLCSRALLPFISNAGLLTFGKITFSAHRGIFIDINLHKFLQTSGAAIFSDTYQPLHLLDCES